MLSWTQISNPQLDIVGIVAVLGEGSTIRNAQASALGWHHVLPRLLPAPQALLKHEQQKRLSTVPGTVVGAYSGNVKFELNFFCQLLHDDNLEENQVELVIVGHADESESKTAYMQVKRWFRRQKQKKNAAVTKEIIKEASTENKPFFKDGEQVYGVKSLGPLVLLSVLGFILSIVMITGSVIYHDGFALLATVLLSSTSSVAGLASWWRLDFKEHPPKDDSQKARQKAIPDSDVVIFYPRQGAFRIIRCSENIARLYFKTEVCEYVFRDTPYRLLALSASILLMFGLLSMSNSQAKMQLAFAVSYISLNALHWAGSALRPTGSWGHWKHKYKCETIPVVLPESKPGALPRIDTTQSFRNIGVVTQEPSRLIGTDAGMTDSPVVASTDSIPEMLFSRNGDPAENTSMRQRRTTAREDSLPSSGSPLGPQSTGIELKSLTLNGLPSSLGTTSILHTQASTSSAKGTKRQNTKDLEGQNVRFFRPWGSVRDNIESWLNHHRLISKRPEEPAANSNGKSETFTTALWKAIAVTGTSQWLRHVHIAPHNSVWTRWIDEAGERAKSRPNTKGELIAACIKDKDGKMQVPPWDYQGRLSDLFLDPEDLVKHRPPLPRTLFDVATIVRNKRQKVKGITPSIEFKLRRLARKAKQQAKETRLRRAENLVSNQRPATDDALTSNIVEHDFAESNGAVAQTEIPSSHA